MKKYRRNKKRNRAEAFFLKHRSTIFMMSLALVFVVAISGFMMTGAPHRQPTDELVEVVVPENILALTGAEESAQILKQYAEMKGVELKTPGVDTTIDVAELYIDGQKIGTMKDTRGINKVLDSFKLRYVDESSEIIDVRFAQNVEVRSAQVGVVQFDGYMSADALKHKIELGTSEIREHEIQPGDNYWIISQNYGIEMEELEAANPEVDPAYLVVGQKIKLVAPTPLLTVISSERIAYTEDIEYETVYEDTDQYYKGQSRVKSSGSYGEVAIEAQLVKENGQIVSRIVVSEKVTSEPVAQVVYVGIKDPPPRMGTGVLGYPLPYYAYVSSEFGDTYYRYFPHTGIDLVCGVGTEVYASDGGTVVAAGWSSSYGYRVLIDHGGNIETLYAHCSSIAVDVGEQVYQGQVIAYSGNTGYSTGPHLHFEVRVNGVYQNPRYYLDF